MNRTLIKSLMSLFFKLSFLFFCVFTISAMVVQTDLEFGAQIESKGDAQPPGVSENNIQGRSAAAIYNTAGWFKQIGEQHYLEISKGTVFHGGDLEKFVRVDDPLADLHTHFFCKDQNCPNDYEFSDLHTINYTSDTTFRMLIRGACVEYQRVSPEEAAKALEAESYRVKA